MSPCTLRIVTVLFLLAAVARGANRTYSVGGYTPPQRVGGWVSIPGSPLPPLPKDAVRDAIVIWERILGTLQLFGRTAAVGRGYGYLATLYASVGEYSKAEHFFDEAQSILEGTADAGRDLGWLHNNRGLVRFNQRRNIDAIRFFRSALAVMKSNAEELREPRAIVLQNLAAAYTIIEDLDQSESAYLEALDILRRSGQEQGRTAAVMRGNLAIVYGSMRDFTAARKLLEQLVGQPGLDPMLRFAALNNLGYVLYASNDSKAAEGYLSKALALTAEGSEDRVLVLTNLAAAHFTAGDLDGAERDGQEALRLAETVHGAASRYAAAVIGSLGTTALARGDLAKAERLLARASELLSRQPGAEGALAGITQELALVAQRRGQHQRAIELSRQALDLEKKNLNRILAFGSESQRLAYRSNASPYDQLANLGDAELLVDAVLTTKGAVLESLLQERAQVRKSRSAAGQQQLDLIHASKVELMERIGRGESNLDALQRELKQQETALARSLRMRTKPVATPATLANVQAALGEGEVLIEIIRYQRYDEGSKTVSCYGGIVISRRGSPAWVPLGAADSIDPLIAGLLQRLDVGSRGMEAPSVAGDVVPTLRELNDRVWNPLARALPAGARNIVLSPDGPMHFIPWAALLDDHENYLAERCQLSQVGSGRDLLRGTSPAPDKTLLAFADGANDLPNTRREVEHLAALAETNGWRPTVLIGDDARETSLTRTPCPRILHFATHGIQLARNGAQSIEGRLSSNPMYRGALLLGGAKKTLEAWKHGSALPAAEDGILTAEEIAGLDLTHTWLTVLSACRTGKGEASVGEGILGLRRGFALAGTENLLFSLWSVDDEATAHFMDVFYDRLFKNGDPARALNETQVEELRRWTKLEDVPSAVFRAAGFVVTR